MDADIPFSKYKTRGILLSLVLCIFIYSILYGIATRIWQVSIDDELQSSILSIFVYIWVLNWVRSKNKQNHIDTSFFFKHSGRLKPFRLFGLIIILFLFSWSTLWLTYCPLSYISPSLVESLILEGELLSSPHSILNNVLEIAILIVIAPVVEEVFFRGILLNRWATKWGIRKAIVFSSIAFAVLHIDFLGAFLFSVVVAILYIKTRTLAVPIAAHILNNAIVLGVTLALEPLQGDFDNISIEGFRSVIWIGITLFIITLPILIVYLKRNWPPRDQQGPYAEQRLRYNSEDGKELSAIV